MNTLVPLRGTRTSLVENGLSLIVVFIVDRSFQRISLNDNTPLIELPCWPLTRYRYRDFKHIEYTYISLIIIDLSDGLHSRPVKRPSTAKPMLIIVYPINYISVFLCIRWEIIGYFYVRSDEYVAFTVYQRSPGTTRWPTAVLYHGWDFVIAASGAEYSMALSALWHEIPIGRQR